MKLLPHNTYRVRLWSFYCFLVLSILCVATLPRPSVIAQQAGFQVEVEEGKTIDMNLNMKNICLESHHYKVTTNLKYLKPLEPADSILIAPGAIRPLALRFDATELKPEIYPGEVVWECTDCKKAQRCSLNRNVIQFQGTVTKRRPIDRPALPSPQLTPIIPTPTPTPSIRTTPPIDNLQINPVVNIHLVFRWHGIIRPGGGNSGILSSPDVLSSGGGGGGGGCSEPLGICITRGFSIASGVLTKAQIAEGYGTATFQVIGNRLRMVFQREAALEDGTIPIDQDNYLKPDVSAALGYESIMLKAGFYKVDRSKEKFGVAFVDIVKVNPTSSAGIFRRRKDADGWTRKATCWCVISALYLGGQRHSDGVIWDLTDEVDTTYTNQYETSQAKCASNCKQKLDDLLIGKKQELANAACAAGVSNGALIRAWSNVGNRQEYRYVGQAGVLINTPEVTETTCTCPKGWLANPTNVDGGVTSDGRCKKYGFGPWAPPPIPANNSPVLVNGVLVGFVWDGHVWAWGTAANGGAATCVTKVLKPAECRFQ